MLTMPVRTAAIYCAVLEDEVAALAKGMPHLVRFEMLPQGLHNEPEKLRSELQALVGRIEDESPDVEAIVAGYGLCSRGTEGVRTKRCRLVLPRAHDCITILLGDRERYAEYVREHPGTYWYSPGWNRHGAPPGKDRYERLRENYVAQFGEEDADYLMEEEQRWFSIYERATFVDLGVGPTDEHEAFTRECANWLGWNYDRQRGDPGLLRALLAGDWDLERFLVLEPGQSLSMTADERVIEAVDAS
jgi:hypothetical protein